MPSLIEDPDGVLRALVDHLGHDLEPSILIGGWATHLRVGGPISHDIDLIIGDDSVRYKLQQKLDELNESNHLQGTKWSGEISGVHMDIYLPHQSMLGARLRLKVEVLAKHAEPIADPTRGWILLIIEAHTISKMAALLDRPTTTKGEKDANEVLALLRKDLDGSVAVDVLISATDGPLDEVPSHITDAFDYVAEYANTNKNDRKWLARLKREWLDYATVALRQLPSLETPKLSGPTGPKLS